MELEYSKSPSNLETPKEGKKGLVCIFYSEFDNVVGPKVSYQVPEGGEFFENIHEYIITKPNLSQKLITLKAFNYKIMGKPTFLEHQKYPRNALVFNLCFVFSEECDVIPWEPIVLKVNAMLKTLEVESEFIFKQNTKMRIQSIIDTIFTKLNQDKQCTIPIDDANTLHLKLFPRYYSPPSVMEHHVPVLTRDMDAIDIKDWDLALQQVITLIDGVNYIKRICQLSGLEFAVVQKCIQHLMYYEYAVLKDIFQYSNVYATTPKIQQLVVDPHLQSECLKLITKRGYTPPPFERVFALYCSLKPGVILRDFCIEHDTHSLNIDDRQFITFGVLNGIIRRVHQYPISLKFLQNKRDNSESLIATKLQNGLNSGQTLDLICCIVSKGHDEVMSLFQSDKEVTILYK